MRKVQSRVVYRKLSELKELEGNPRTIKKEDFERLKKSLKDNADYFEARPIILSNRTGELVILAGNQRYKAAKAIGMQEVPTILLEGLSEAREKEIIIRDNVENGDWDMDILANEWNADVLESWGVELPDWVSEPEQEIIEDEAPEPPAEPKSKLGEIYQLGEHRLMCGDSTDAEQVAKLMNGEKADIAFASPPYNAGFGQNITKDNGRSKYLNDNDNKTQEEYAGFLGSYIDNASTHSKYNFVNIQMLANNKRAMFDAIYERIGRLADIIIWDKERSQPQLADNVLNSEFEFIFVFSEKANRHIGTIPFHGTLKNIVHISPGRNEYADEHNAVFPVELPSHFVANFAKKTVLDLFGGSGTTLIACEQLGRKCFMMELDPQYVDVIIERWENFTGKKAQKIRSDGNEF